MKKIICASLAIILCFSMVSCGKKPVDTPQPTPTQKVVNTPTPTTEITPTPIPTPTPIIEKEFDPKIEVSYTENNVPMNKMVFGEATDMLFPTNSEILVNEFPNHIDGNNPGGSIHLRAIQNEESLIDEKIYLAQTHDFISLTFAVKTDKYTEGKDIEQYCDSIREFTGLFIPDIDLYDILMDIYNNFDSYIAFYNKDQDDEHKVSQFDKTIWLSDNTEFISLYINVYEDENEEVVVELFTNFTLHNDDVLYSEDIRTDFNLSVVRRTNDNAFVGTIVGAKNSGKKVSAMDYIDIIEWPIEETKNDEQENIDPETQEQIEEPTPEPEPEVIDEVVIPANSYSGQAYEIPRKETEKGNALDLSGLKGSFDLTSFKFSDDKNYVIASSEDGNTTCQIPVSGTDFKFKTDKDFFLEAVQFFTGYNITSSTIEELELENGTYQLVYEEHLTGYHITINDDIYELN